MNKEIYIKNIKASSKQIPCDLVIKNITIIDVFQNSTFISDVGIIDKYIVGIGEYSGIKEIDGYKKYICPGIIDAHAHIESSLLTPREYYKTALLHGITSLIADPHEIANVLGIDGIKLMIDFSKDIPFDFYFMLPSCVPATTFENSGAILRSHDLKTLYENEKIIGLAEVMDFQSIVNCNEDMINKLYDAYKNNFIIDGHASDFNNDQLNVCATSYIKTDHECRSYNELVERVRRGFYVHIREGTIAKNLKELIKAVSVHNSRKICLCTDDKHIDDLLKHGSIDNSIRMCIKNGLSPEISIQMGTLNVAECYGLKTKGAIAPGYIADFLILDSLHDFKISSVYKNGKLVVENNSLKVDTHDNFKINFKTTIKIPKLEKHNFNITLKNKSIINVIEIIPNDLRTNHLKIKISDLENQNEFIQCTSKDLLKIGVIERHNNTQNIGIGIVKGLMLEHGAIATTIAHDSHNLIVCGTNDEDMILACNKIKEIDGGIVIVKNGKLISHLKLEIGGLITNRKTNEVIEDLKNLYIGVKEIAPKINFNPFLTLSFLSLPVIPDIKITDKGIFDVKNLKFINISE